MEATAIRVEAFMLCRALDTVENVFYILGGGWSTVGFFSFPGLLQPFHIATRLIVPFTDTNQELEFEVKMEDEDGVNILPGPMRPRVTVGRPVDLTRGEEQAVHIPLGFENIAIPRAGTYVFLFLYQGRELARTFFTAVPLGPGVQIMPD
jgi:hypothetical protein